MRTEQLIADLAGRVTAVTPLASPAARFAWWCGAAITSAAAGVGAFGARSGIQQRADDADFLVTAGMALATAAGGALTSLVLAVPGAERSRPYRPAAFALLAAWTVVMLGSLARSGHGFVNDTHWPVCFLRVLLIGAAPAWVLFRMLRRGWPVRHRSASALAALASAAVGSAAIQFICPLDGPSHALLGHIGPALVTCGVAAWAASQLVLAPTER
jgi:hypothetical protein